jgi:muscarinic acetylcholine receptor
MKTEYRSLKYILLATFLFFCIKTADSARISILKLTKYEQAILESNELQAVIQSNDKLNDTLTNHNGFDVIFSDETFPGSSAQNKSFKDAQEATSDASVSEVYSLPAKIVLSTLAATASLITICGNLLVMCSFFLDRQIRNPTNYFILSLSVSDFIIGLISIPFLTFYLMIGEWPFGQIVCNLWLSLDYTVCLTSIYTVLFITIDRFCSVKMPAKYRKWRSPNKIVVMVMLTWLVPFSLFFPSIFGWSYGVQSEYNPKVCDVAWSNNKAFSVTLVFAYFWTTLVAIIVLYIFIYQVARNLERKSREKQRKLSSLVGCSATNTGALVGVVALPPAVSNAVANKLSKRDDANSPEDNDEADEDFNTDSQSKLSKGSIKKRKKEHLKFMKKSIKGTSAIGSIGFITSGGGLIQTSLNSKQDDANRKLTMDNSTNTTSSNSTSNNTSNVAAAAPNRANLGSHASSNLLKVKNSTGAANNNKLTVDKLKSTNHSYSSTMSKDDDFSSSYDSHSDYDSGAKFKKKPDSIKKSEHVAPVEPKRKQSSKMMSVDKANHGPIEPLSLPQTHSLQPRPETLAVLSHDLFIEKCAKQSSSNVNSLTKSPTQSMNPVVLNQEVNRSAVAEPVLEKQKSIESASAPATNIPEPAKADNLTTVSEATRLKKSASNLKQIPFIDEEFEELSYVLHRRQFGDKENKVPIKEETIFIKTPLSGFFQKFSPMRPFSRRSSQKSLSEANNRSARAKLDALNNQSSNDLKTQECIGLLDSSAKPEDAEAKAEADIKPAEKENEAETQADGNETNEASTSPPNLIVNSQSEAKATQATVSVTTTTSTTESNLPASLAMKTSDALATITSNATFDKQTSALSKQTSDQTTMVARNPVVAKQPAKRKTKHENRARKALRTITFILGAFIFCFAPWHVVTILNPFCSTCFDYKLYHHFFYSCYFLCYMNSPINPFMYALANQQFRKTFFRILKGDLRRL